MIPFNKPFLTGKETDYIKEAVESGKISGNGIFSKKCQAFFETQYRFKKALLTTSCTDALEMAAILADIKPGDEVIIPSYTFVSTALPFIRQGAKVIFADSQKNHPNIDVHSLEKLISKKTKAIVPVHYAGMACEMNYLLELSRRHNLLIIEDAAQAIDSYYNGNPLGGFGHLSAFSFHETKNIIAGEGGLLAVNDDRFIKRAEIIWEKGTNRAEFFRGEVNKYGWVDIGSSFLPSEIIAAFLYAQLENLRKIQERRKVIWEKYYSELLTLSEKEMLQLPSIPNLATNNAHMFYIICKSLDERNSLIAHLKGKGIMAVFHYLSLHKSEYYQAQHDGRLLPNADRFTDQLLRLPFYYELKEQDQDIVITEILNFYKNL